MRSDGCLTLDEGVPFRMAEKDFDGPESWRGADLTPDDWTVSLDKSALAELAGVVARLRKHALPTLMLTPEMFDLAVVRETVAEIKRRLSEGRRFAVLGRLPLDDWTLEEAKPVYWLVAQLLSQPVAQEWNGMMFKDVVDSGTDYDSGNERAVTNRALLYHIDNSGNIARPEFSSLLCVHPAMSGGLSQYCSVYSLHNALRRAHPGLLDRLYRPYYHDRQGIQPPGEPGVLIAPALTYDGARLQCRYSGNKIRGGYAKMQEPVDAEGDAALDAVVDIIQQENLAVEFALERGQIFFYNNLEGLHHRSDFIDNPDPQKRRHLMRIWHRDHGRPFFDG